MAPKLHQLALLCKVAAEQRQFEADIKAKERRHKSNTELEGQELVQIPISETPFEDLVMGKEGAEQQFDRS